MHQYNDKTLGDSEGQGTLECYSPWGHKELGYDRANEQGQNYNERSK